MKREDEYKELKQVLRGYLGMEEPVAPPPQSSTEAMSERALEVWNFMLSKSGLIPDFPDRK